jgi:hypothetical protein
MKPRIVPSVPLLVLVAVLALVLGSVGTATAAGLTTSQVKKIAAKVVKKSAPSLSVAHATTADTATTAGTATTLLGQPASQYKNPVYRFVLPVQPVAASRSYTFPGLPAGTYLIGYSVFASLTASGTDFVCQARAGATAPWEVFSGSSRYGTFNATSEATAALTLTGAPPEVFCTSPGTTFSIYSATNYLSTVTFTRVDGITNGAVTSRPAGDGAPRTQQP